MLDQRRYQLEPLPAPRALELVIVVRGRVQMRGEREDRAEGSVTDMTLVGIAIECEGRREQAYEYGSLRLRLTARALNALPHRDGWDDIERLYRGSHFMSVDPVEPRFDVVGYRGWGLKCLRADHTVEAAPLVDGCGVLKWNHQRL